MSALSIRPDLARQHGCQIMQLRSYFQSGCTAKYFGNSRQLAPQLRSEIFHRVGVASGSARKLVLRWTFSIEMQVKQLISIEAS